MQLRQGWGYLERGENVTDIDRELAISRRGALGAIAGAGLGLELLTGASVAEASRHKRMIMLIRHGEKPVGSGPPFGVDAGGTQSDKSLTVVGWQRAGALVELFDPSDGRIRRGLARPNALFASNPGTHGSQRPLETITPLSQRLGFSVRTPVRDSQTAQIAQILIATPGVLLAAWQHQDIPSIARQLGTVHPQPPKKWPGHRFDIVWVFTPGPYGSWKFTQIPQLLLAGDKHSVIK